MRRSRGFVEISEIASVSYLTQTSYSIDPMVHVGDIWLIIGIGSGVSKTITNSFRGAIFFRPFFESFREKVWLRAGGG